MGEVTKMSDFKWTRKRQRAAILLAEAYTVDEVAEEVGVTDRTIYRWKNDIEFAAEVDRLSCMVDISGRAERLRIAMRMARKKADRSEKDLLDWLKFAQSETDGVKLDLTALAEAATSVADSGSGGTASPQRAAEPTERG